MPTTILDGETYEEARYRRFSEEAKEIEKMTKPTCPDIIAMAIEAGAYIDPDELEIYLLSQHCFEDFFNLAFAAGAAHEREACAKLCEQGWKNGIGAKYQGDVFAAAIRARGEK